jgi:DNA-binding GntR family transcriptional regulator
LSGQSIAQRLHDEILNGDLAPGTRLRQEEIAERFGSSRLPVRDALRRLEADGLVTIVSNSGAWVSKLNYQECNDAYEVRERLEPLLLSQSLPGLSNEHLDQLDELCNQMESCGDVETFLRLDREFHLLSYAGVESGMVRDIVLKLWNTTQHYRRAFVELNGLSEGGTTHLQHRLFVDALRRNDVGEAQSVLVSHIRRTRKSLEENPAIFA